MIYLIDYDSRENKLIELREFKDSEKLRAEYEKVQIELNLTKRGLLLREVVLLEARDLSELKRVHARYFQIATDPTTGSPCAQSSNDIDQ